MGRTINDKLTKEKWYRRAYPEDGLRVRSKYKPVQGFGNKKVLVQLTQDDFLNELAPSAHSVNSEYMSQRPIWKPTGDKDKQGREKWELVGYDDLASVSLGWQEFIVGNKIAHLATKGYWISNETEDQESFETLLSYMDSAGIKDGYFEAINATERTGDAGLYIYQGDDNQLHYKVFSYEFGYSVYPHIDENGDNEFYVEYNFLGKRCVDYYSKKTIETWTTDDGNLSFFDRIRKEIRNEKTDDGWILVRRKQAQAGADLCQFIYFRVPDIASGPAQDTIEELENTASFSANEVKDACFPILFLKSEKVVSLPPSNTNAKTLAVKGTADNVKNSDAKYLNPGDPSSLNESHVRELKENIIRSTHTVIIEPEIMKQGADSSTAIKILFRPEIGWATCRWKLHYAEPTRQMISVCKRLVGKIEGNLSVYDNLRTSCGEDIWIPQNQQETEKMVLDKVYARVISRKAAMQELGNQYRGDYEQIQKEWEDELELKAKYSASGQSDDNSNPADVNNQALGQSIQQ